MLITSLKSTYSRSRLYFGLLASMVIAGGLFLTYIQPGTIDTDGGIFSAVAFKDMHGGKLYQDTWENKPPGIFYLIELFYFLIPNPVYALFIMSLFAMLSLAAILFYLFYKYFESLFISLLYMGLTLYFTVHENNIKDGLYTEIYGTLCLVGSLAFFEYYRQHAGNKMLVLTGLSLGCSFWFKEPFILICIPLFIYYILVIKNKKTSSRLIVYAALPSLFFLALLSFDQSVSAFFETFLYNFQYSSQQETNDFKVKTGDYYKNLIQPVLGLSLLLLFVIYKNFSNKKTRDESLIFFSIFICSTFFVYLSPYNLGHYYFPSFVLFFVLLAKQCAILKTSQSSMSLPLMIILFYYIYTIDHTANPRFTFRINPYVPDKITERLRKDKDATLFVDYVKMGGYYIKAGKIHPAFLPVGLPVHFDNSEKGKKNIDRIWKELSTKPPDYLITTFTTAYFSWHFPETKFYVKNYEKIDSVYPPDEFIIYLWKHKKQSANGL